MKKKKQNDWIEVRRDSNCYFTEKLKIPGGWLYRDVIFSDKVNLVFVPNYRKEKKNG